jgi:hypothetical protein
LIKHASKDLEEIDKKREEQFKEYELRKEYQRRTKLAVSDFDNLNKQNSLLYRKSMLHNVKD